ncbi:MAG: T9SS type A sorting domain-containing protein, partial [Mariniphaga sp.]|nr:T9SS type A sorting domain-containing protein [Mariniphaga sp.]
SSFYKNISAFLDEFRIWRRPVNAQEVESLFKNGLAKIVDDVSIQPQYRSKSCDVTVYPNPAKDMITLEYNAQENGDAYFLVFNMMGTLIQELQFPGHIGRNQVVLDVSGFNPGVYLVRTFSAGISETVRFMVLQ